MKKQVSKTTVLCAIASLLVVVLTLTAWFVFLPYYNSKHFVAAAPSNLNTVSALEPKAAYGDFYISPDGDDSNNGTYEHPFRTVAAAQKAVRKMDKQYLSHIVVSILGGTYQTDGLKFTKKDSGTDSCSVIYCAYGNGEVIFDGGASYDERRQSDSSSLVEVDGASYFSISGISFINAKGSGITLKGSNINIDGCRIQDIAGCGIVCDGNKISVSSCIINYTGASGITVNGGEMKTLSPSNNSIDNNLISYTSQNNPQAPSAMLSGVGTVFSNNEIVNSPACAVYYTGNGNVIEYNYIHNTVLTDSSQAAIDSPYFRWDCYGNFVRYNCLNLIGTKIVGGDFCGIRACSGTEIVQNILLNIFGQNATGIQLNGCRDVTVKNNIFVNTGLAVNADEYDRAYEQEALELLENSPYQSKEWKKMFPTCAEISTDSQQDGYAVHPCGNTVTDNIAMQSANSIGHFAGEFKKGADIKTNAVFSLGHRHVFTDFKNGIYTIDANSEVFGSNSEFEDIPFESIGRY